MTVWDSMNLNAPHTERKIRGIAETGADGMPMKLDGFPLLEEAITETFGARCDEYMPGCACCDTWAELDRLRAIRAAEARDMAVALRELAAEADTAPSGTTEPQDATSPSAGLSGECEEHRLIVAAREALAIAKAQNMTLDEAWAQRLSNLKPYATDEAIAHAMRNDAGWMAWQEVKRLRAKLSDTLAIVTAEKANWPHAGAMHDGARMACNNIIRQLEARGE